MLRLAGVCCCFSALCVAAAPVPRESQKPHFFPSRIGTTWVYQKVGGFASSCTITHVEEKSDGARIVTIGWLDDDGEVQTKRRVLLSSQGLYRLDVARGELDSPMCVLKLPLRPRQSWDFHKKGRKIPEARGTRTAFEPEEVEVPAGKYLAVRVEAKWKYTDEDEKDAPWRATEWFAPNIGVVKFVDSDGDEFLLKSFTLGKR
jgi:hypothetical protein